MTLELRATPAEVMRAVAAVEHFALSCQLPKRTVFGLALALEECASNIVDHAFRRDPQKTFRVTIDHTPGVFSIELRDSGPSFDPTAALGSHHLNNSNESVGGWGIPLVRLYTDEVRYARVGNENVLRLTWHLDQAGHHKLFRSKSS